MAIVLGSELTSSVKTPSPSKVSIFFDQNSKNLYLKKPTGNLTKIGNAGQTFISFAFNETNETNTNTNLGTFLLNSGTLSNSSSIYCGTILGQSNCVVDLYRESNNTLITTWTSDLSTLNQVTMSLDANIPSNDWYSLRFRLQNVGGGDIAIVNGANLVFD